MLINFTEINELYYKRIHYGIKTGLNETFVIGKETYNRLISEDPKCKELISPYLVGKDLKRYQPPKSDRYLILIPKGWTKRQSKGVTDSWHWLMKNYSSIASHLKPFTEKAQKRYDKGDYWWELRTCDYYDEFKNIKVCWGNLSNEAPFTIDFEGAYINAPACILSLSDKYLLGCLNSKLLWWFLKKIAAERRGGFIEAKPIYVQQIPIRTIDHTNPTDTARHHRMAELVEKMLELHKEQNESLNKEKTNLQKEIEETDKQIDKLVYELYGLTEEEIKIIEEGT